MFKTARVAALLTCLALPASAKPVVYYCEMAGGNFIASDMLLQIDPQGPKVEVFDGLLKAFNNNKPMVAKVTADTAARTSFTWEVKNVRAGGESLRLVFRATLQKADRTLQLTAQPVSYDNTFSGNGRCRVDR